ncbi:hypothetical protein KAW38_02120 [Candidatus Micrarchaeota archaeon]|nr:hypothetical protein [Candidatus Micrarchaeota archaeon]
MITKKGQAAMEYLMTYGWALLVIVIVIAALIYLNPFRAPETCIFQQQGLSCSEPLPIVYLDNGEVYISVRVWNKLGQTIEISKVICTTARTSQIDTSTITGKVVDPEVLTEGKITPGSDSDFLAVPCVGADGNIVALAQNQEFKGTLIILYNYEDDIDPAIRHVATANVISTVAQK